MQDREQWELDRAFQEALADGRERAWMLFVDRAEVHARDLTSVELGWLKETASATWHLRVTTFLVHALGAICTTRPDFRADAAVLFENWAAHASALVRGVVLEWAPELGREVALQLATKLRVDTDAGVREQAEATLLSPLTRYEAAFFRIREVDDAHLLEVAKIGWDGPHEPVAEWHPYARWSARPSAVEIARAKDRALADGRFFARCAVCKERCARGHLTSLHRRGANSRVCDPCGHSHYGIIH